MVLNMDTVKSFGQILHMKENLKTMLLTEKAIIFGQMATNIKVCLKIILWRVMVLLLGNVDENILEHTKMIKRKGMVLFSGLMVGCILAIGKMGNNMVKGSILIQKEDS